MKESGKVAPSEHWQAFYYVAYVMLLRKIVQPHNPSHLLTKDSCPTERRFLLHVPKRKQFQKIILSLNIHDV